LQGLANWSELNFFLACFCGVHWPGSLLCALVEAVLGWKSALSALSSLSIYAANGAVRGLISGLGLLNLWIAFHDAIRHGTDSNE